MALNRPFQSIRSFLVLLLGCGILLGPGSFAASAQVTGNTYTSPNFGYSLNWNDTWFVEEETTEPGYDFLGLTNGVAFVALFGEAIRFPPRFTLTGLETSYNADPTVANFRIQTDAAGNELKTIEDDRAFAFYACTYLFDDGSSVDVGIYVESRTLVPGESLVSFIGSSEITYFNSMMVEFEAMLATLSVPGAVETPEQVEEEPARAVEGEPAPAFVSGAWRVGIAHAAMNPSLPDIDLAEKDGNQWVVIVVDITNWSAGLANLNLRDFRVTSGDEHARVAPASTRAIAGVLGTTEIGEELELTLQSDESMRVALAFSVPDGFTDLMLTNGDVRIPLDDLLDVNLAPEDMSAPAVPAGVQLAEVVSASDGRTMRVLIDGATDSTRVQLAGVEPPAKGDCFEHAAENVLDDLAGTNVLIEEDAEISGGKIPARYVWLVNPDGTRTLLNHELVANGAAKAGQLPAAARFDLWLTTTSEDAERANTGLWAGCETPEASTSPAATPIDD